MMKMIPSIVLTIMLASSGNVLASSQYEKSTQWLVCATEADARVAAKKLPHTSGEEKKVLPGCLFEVFTQEQESGPFIPINTAVSVLVDYPVKILRVRKFQEVEVTSTYYIRVN